MADLTNVSGGAGDMMSLVKDAGISEKETDSHADGDSSDGVAGGGGVGGDATAAQDDEDAENALAENIARKVKVLLGRFCHNLHRKPSISLSKSIHCTSTHSFCLFLPFFRSITVTVLCVASFLCPPCHHRHGDTMTSACVFRLQWL
jgi:hypothetical protein